MKTREVSEDDQCLDTIAVEITNAVRKRPKFGQDCLRISRKVSEDDRCLDRIAFEITNAVRRRPKFGQDCR
ncbi:hypothetical protein M3610_03785 [Neobacillus sp. MER 74]|uniref:hypothetical protein n=1 Tax=Neobacillus sp. MER 74 TaxID=2939566 RepID=UPI00203E8375|nr:hypothetical protein [Neobacillus sp. MER 74]MCM3114417.1 hypothetical protein [Neobacillus sp. MER 74]